MDCNPARTSGRNLTRYSARNRTSSSGRCSRSGGRSSGGSSRTGSLRRSSASPSGRDFGSYEDSYGGGIGGVGKGIGVRSLRIGKLGHSSGVDGICAILHIDGSGMKGNSARPRVRPVETSVLSPLLPGPVPGYCALGSAVRSFSRYSSSVLSTNGQNSSVSRSWSVRPGTNSSGCLPTKSRTRLERGSLRS